LDAAAFSLRDRLPVPCDAPACHGRYAPRNNLPPKEHHALNSASTRFAPLPGAATGRRWEQTTCCGRATWRGTLCLTLHLPRRTAPPGARLAPPVTTSPHSFARCLRCSSSYLLLATFTMRAKHFTLTHTAHARHTCTTLHTLLSAHTHAHPTPPHPPRCTLTHLDLLGGLPGWASRISSDGRGHGHCDSLPACLRITIPLILSRTYAQATPRVCLITGPLHIFIFSPGTDVVSCGRNDFTKRAVCTLPPPAAWPARRILSTSLGAPHGWDSHAGRQLTAPS